MTWLADTIRITNLILSGLVAGACLGAVWRHNTIDRFQDCRFLGLAFVVVGISIANYRAIGVPIVRASSWWLLTLILVGLVFSLVGTLPTAFRHNQRV